MVRRSASSAPGNPLPGTFAALPEQRCVDPPGVHVGKLALPLIQQPENRELRIENFAGGRKKSLTSRTRSRSAFIAMPTSTHG